MKKGRLKVIFMNICALIIIIVAMFLMWKPEKPKHRLKPVENESVTTNVINPVYRKDGELQFRDQKDNLLVTISVEIADNEVKRIQGLMYRDSLPAMSGMFFMFETEELQSFWMKNTRFSLDIIYINAERKVVSISRNAKPYSLESLPSSAPAMYVVEVPAGFASKYNINENCRIVF